MIRWKRVWNFIEKLRDGQGFLRAIGNVDPTALAILTVLLLGLSIAGLGYWNNRRIRARALAGLEELDRARRESGADVGDWAVVINKGIRR